MYGPGIVSHIIDQSATYEESKNRVLGTTIANKQLTYRP